MGRGGSRALGRGSRALCAETHPVLVEMTEGGKFATLTLNRPHVHNALNEGIVNGIKTTLEALRGPEHAGLRAVFLKATGKTFCGGGDLKDFKASATDPPVENHAKAVAFAAFLKEVNTFPRPVIGMVSGPAFGGGVGIISVCDIAFTVERAVFTLSEVKLGLIPATISPYVVARIGEFASRRYFTTAERFDANEAKRIGLVHDVVADDAALAEKEAVRRTLSLSRSRSLSLSLSPPPHPRARVSALALRRPTHSPLPSLTPPNAARIIGSIALCSCPACFLARTRRS